MLTELQKQALVEGVTTDDAPETKPAETVKTDVKQESVSSTPQTDQTQPVGAVKTDSDTSLPFGKDPAVQRYIERQVSKREKEWQKKLETAQTEYIKRLESVSQPRSSQPNPNGLPPDQEKALLDFAEVFFNNPSIRDKYGLNKYEATEKQLNEMRQEAAYKTYLSELDRSATNYASQYGYDKSELLEDIQSFIETNPLFKSVGYQEGIADWAVKLFFADKSKELAEREANLKLLKEQNEKKKMNLESSSNGKKAPTSAKDTNMKSFLERRIQESGGMDFDD